MLLVICFLGCDSKAIITLLCSRTNSQRQRIELEYKTMYGRVSLWCSPSGYVFGRCFSKLAISWLRFNHSKSKLIIIKFPPWSMFSWRSEEWSTWQPKPINFVDNTRAFFTQNFSYMSFWWNLRRRRYFALQKQENTHNMPAITWFYSVWQLS